MLLLAAAAPLASWGLAALHCNPWVSSCWAQPDCGMRQGHSQGAAACAGAGWGWFTDGCEPEAPVSLAGLASHLALGRTTGVVWPSLGAPCGSSDAAGAGDGAPARCRAQVLAPLLPGPAGGAEVLERHRADSVNLRGVLQPDTTERGNPGLAEETEELETKSLSGHLMQCRSKRTNRIYRHSLDWEICLQSQFVSFYRPERF